MTKVVETRKLLDQMDKLSEFERSICGEKSFTEDSKPKETIEETNEKPLKNTGKSEQEEEVCNVVGSTEDAPPSEYDSWLDYWEKNTSNTVQDFFTCPSCNKTKQIKVLNDKGEMVDGAVGGHVENQNGESFICPICKKCNDGKGNTPAFRVSKEQLLPLPVQKK